MSYSLEAPVLDNVRFPRHNYLLSLRAPKIARSVSPGQFVMAAEVGALSLPYPLLKRALAVYSTKEEAGQPSIITLLLKVIGDGTRRLASLQSNDTVSLIGPLGTSFNLEQARGRVNLLVAGGIGIASFYLLAETLRKMDEQVHLIYGGRTADDLVGVEDFRNLGIPVFCTTEDGSCGLKGLVTDALERHLEELPSKQRLIYTCGPTPMMRAVSCLAASKKIPCQISVEAKMACGFGVCLGCSIKTIHSYRLACQSGPVFHAEEFVWEDAES